MPADDAGPMLYNPPAIADVREVAAKLPRKI